MSFTTITKSFGLQSIRTLPRRAFLVTDDQKKVVFIEKEMNDGKSVKMGLFIRGKSRRNTDAQGVITTMPTPLHEQLLIAASDEVLKASGFANDKAATEEGHKGSKIVVLPDGSRQVLVKITRVKLSDKRLEASGGWAEGAPDEEGRPVGVWVTVVIRKEVFEQLKALPEDKAGRGHGIVHGSRISMSGVQDIEGQPGAVTFKEVMAWEPKPKADLTEGKLMAAKGPKPEGTAAVEAAGKAIGAVAAKVAKKAKTL